MKNSIEGFSQAMLVQYKLKADDALILRWFLDFAACGKMKRLIAKDSSGNKTVYYWVNYQAVIEQFPCLDIKSTKSIQIKFNRYAELGILEKTVVSGGSKGLQSYFAITDKLLDFEYSSIPHPAAEKIRILENKLTAEQKVLSSEQETNPDIDDENHTVKNKTGNEKKNISDTFGQEKNFQSSQKQEPEWKNNSSPEVPLEKKFHSGQEKNFQSVLINSSTINSSNTLSNSSLNQRAEILSDAVKKYFDGSLAMFSDDLIPKLTKLTQELNSERLEHYVKYVYFLCKAQKPKKLQGLFYKFILQNNTYHAFLESIQDVPQKTKRWNCPVCGKENHVYIDCKCGCTYNGRNDISHINQIKQINNLKEGQKEMFYSELSNISINLPFSEQSVLRHNIFKKYGIRS
ncbi:MAG: hypothetical protein ACI4MA_00440 [Treponema sp.]